MEPKSPVRFRATPFFVAAAASAILAVLAAFLGAPFVLPMLAAAAAAALAMHAWHRRRSLRQSAKLAGLMHKLEALEDKAWELRDSEERYRLLIEERDRAEAASDAKSRFLAMVSHEIRTPLNGILGLAAVMQETELTAEQENFTRAIRASGGMLLGLVDDMLDLAKIEAGRLDLMPEPTDPVALVQDIVELLAARAFAKGVDLAFYAAPNLPAEVVVDGARLRQVLVNLIGNAIKFTDRGGIAVSVERQAGATGEVDLLFSVADSGPGMDADVIERLLGPEKAEDEPVSRRFRGSGLGLPISREILRHMGGELEISSRSSGGTIVRFKLGLDVAPAAAGDAVTEIAAGHRCLIVAPESIGADIAARHLAEAGVDTRMVSVPARAAALAAAASAAGLAYDFLLIDARLQPDTAAALDEIRQAAGARIPAAILIEPGRRKSVPALREAGFDAYLVRPLRRLSLLKIANTLISRSADFGIDPSDERRPNGRLAHLGDRPMDVLLVEDNEINALLLRAVLERLGHRVTEFRDGRDAVNAVEGRDFDLALLDINLPGLDGISVARVLRGRGRPPGRPAPILVAITGEVSGSVRSEAGAAGFDAFLEKPVEPETLRNLIDRLRLPSAA